ENVVTMLGTGVAGEILEVGEVANNLLWIKLETEYGTGWAAENFFARGDSASTLHQFSAGAAVYVNTDALNIREQPAIDADPVAVLPTNATGTITAGPEESDGHTWYQVETAEGAGWAAAQFLSKGTPDPATTGGIRAGDQIGLDTGALNIRAEPGTAGEWVAALQPGETASVIDGPREADGYSWWKIVAPSGEGWAVRITWSVWTAPDSSLGTPPGCSMASSTCGKPARWAPKSSRFFRTRPMSKSWKAR